MGKTSTKKNQYQLIREEPGWISPQRMEGEKCLL